MIESSNLSKYSSGELRLLSISSILDFSVNGCCCCSYKHIIDNWHNDFDMQPAKLTIYSLAKQFEDIGSVGNIPSSGRLHTNDRCQL